MQFLSTTAFCLSLLVAAVLSAPTESSDEQYKYGVRMPRATCDLGSLSIGGVSLNHSACAAHCLVLGRGFKGGRCRDGVCHCRR